MDDSPEDAASDPAREALRQELERALGPLEPASLDRAWVFDAVARGDVSFTLALVTRRMDDDRLEMVAVGGRLDPSTALSHDFIRRARFPAALLHEILAEFIDRCGVEGAAHREVPLSDLDDPLERLVDLLAAPAPGP